MSDFVLPGHYKLLSAVITTLDGKSVDIVGLIPSFTIEESLDNSSLRGTATVYDNIGFIESLPLRGEEILTIQIEDALKQRLTYELAIYKITDVDIKRSNDGLVYKIHFISKSSFDAMFRKIIEPFNSKISDIVDMIFKKYFTGEKELLLEPTVGIFRCIIPNYTPIQAMNFLAQRSYSTESPSCSFRFFETSENYYFVSDEYLIKRFLDDKSQIKEFIFSDALEKSGKDFISQMQNLIEIKNSDRVNSIMDLSSGAYRSRVIEIDINYRRVNLPGKSLDNEFDYQVEKNKYVSVSGKGRSQGVHSDEFINSYFNVENERRYIVVKDWDPDGSRQLRGDQFIPEIVMNRVAYRHHLNNTIVYAKSHGRLDLKAGDLINVKIPEFTSSRIKKINPQLSGYYMINDVLHTFETDIHETSLKLVKYDWSTQE